MKSTIQQNQLLFVWACLLLLGVSGLIAVEASLYGLFFSLSMLIVAVIKIQLIAEWYMGLREVRLLWRMIMLVWLGLFAYAVYVQGSVVHV